MMLLQIVVRVGGLGGGGLLWDTRFQVRSQATAHIQCTHGSTRWVRRSSSVGAVQTEPAQLLCSLCTGVGGWGSDSARA